MDIGVVSTFVDARDRGRGRGIEERWSKGANLQFQDKQVVGT